MSIKKEREPGELSSDDSDIIVIEDDDEVEPSLICKKRKITDLEFTDDTFEDTFGISFEPKKKVEEVVIVEDEEDDDVLELFCTTRQENKNRKKDPYFNDDYLVDLNEVKKRWNVKTLANPNTNLSLKNYRFRLYGEKNEYERTIRPGIFFEEKETQLENGVDSQRDENEFHQQIDQIRAKLVKQKEESKKLYDQKLNKIIEIHNEETKRICKIFGLGSIEEKTQTLLANNIYQTAVNNLNENYRQKIATMTEYFKNEEDALFALFNSKSYQKGKLSQYTVFDLFQPTSSTKNIYDDGHRRIFCTVNAGKNIKIEDELYDKYYGYK